MNAIPSVLLIKPALFWSLHLKNKNSKTREQGAFLVVASTGSRTFKDLTGLLSGRLSTFSSARKSHENCSDVTSKVKLVQERRERHAIPELDCHGVCVRTRRFVWELNFVPPTRYRQLSVIRSDLSTTLVQFCHPRPQKVVCLSWGNHPLRRLW